MVRINYSPVKFDELTHTYTRYDGVELSGITSILHDYLFPDMYANVDNAVLERKKLYGSLVHSQIQMIVEKMPFHEELKETKAFRKLCKGINFILSEYLVSDEEHIASSIDLVDDNYNLYDIKTTSVLNKEYLQWQLSMYAVLFEMQNPGIEVGKLYAIHLRGNEAKLVEIQRLNADMVYQLYYAYVNKVNPENFVNPLHRANKAEIDLADEYKLLAADLADVYAAAKPIEDRMNAILDEFKSRMDANGNKKLDNELFTVTRTADSSYKTYSFDMNKFLESNKPTKAMKDFVSKSFDYKKYVEAGGKVSDAMKECVTEKDVVRNGKVTIKFKNV